MKNDGIDGLAAFRNRSAASILWLYRREAKDTEAARGVGNPIAIVPALGFVAFLALAIIASHWAATRFGESGIATMLVVMGSLDVDAAIVTAGGLPSSAIAMFC